MNRSEDMQSGATWLAGNKGFLSVVFGFGGVIVTLIGIAVGTAMWADNIVDELRLQDATIHHRIDVAERRLTTVEKANDTFSHTLRSVADEQLRRTSPVSEIKAIHEKLNRIQERLEPPNDRFHEQL